MSVPARRNSLEPIEEDGGWMDGGWWVSRCSFSPLCVKMSPLIQHTAPASPRALLSPDLLVPVVSVC